MNAPGQRYLAVWPTEPDPSDLDEQVDWMSYSHQQLYDMVHNGVDLTGATHVAAGWATLAESLQSIGDRLGAALRASVDGWQGPAADQARNAIGTLVSWARDTGDAADAMAGCLTRQVDNLQTARSSMPAPVLAPVGMFTHSGTPGLPEPDAGSATVGPGTTRTSSAGSFAAGPAIAVSPIVNVRQQQAAHQQAARVMQQLQDGSRAVYTTVPQFAAPPSPVAGPRQGPVSLPPGPMPPVGNEPVGGMPMPGAAGWFGRTSGGGPAPAARTGGAPAAVTDNAAGRGASSGATARAGGVGADEVGAPTGRAPSGIGTGVGGFGGGRRREDDQHHAPKYLEDDQEIFGIDGIIAPPVIGE
ncbi:MAG TPA: PPE domain-containing protein [Pseudonocardiaceae bacterium]|nr:PPE domain-containing protein [Pseudonocardiaceae bacterium]